MTMPNRMTSVIGMIRLKAFRPTATTITISISSVPYAAEEIPSQDSTPRASGLESRSVRSCSLTIGGPSRRRFACVPEGFREFGPLAACEHAGRPTYCH